MTDNPINSDEPAVTAEGGSIFGAPWQQQDPVLRDLWMQNKTSQEISEILGRSIPAIMTRAARLGLPRRSAPGRKPGSGASHRLPRYDEANEIPPQNQRRSLASPDDTYVTPASQATLRICLMCLRKFESAGRHNRICSPCKGSSEYGQASTLPDIHLPQG